MNYIYVNNEKYNLTIYNHFYKILILMQNIKARIQTIEKRLAELHVEKIQLEDELNKLQAENDLTSIHVSPSVDGSPLSIKEKIDLFVKLFRCREDVYAKYWENKNKGIKGFSPVCKNEWIKGLCSKPKVKCSECPNRQFESFDIDAVFTRSAVSIPTGTGVEKVA